MNTKHPNTELQMLKQNILQPSVFSTSCPLLACLDESTLNTWAHVCVIVWHADYSKNRQMTLESQRVNRSPNTSTETLQRVELGDLTKQI